MVNLCSVIYCRVRLVLLHIQFFALFRGCGRYGVGPERSKGKIQVISRVCLISSRFPKVGMIFVRLDNECLASGHGPGDT
jgi:hypothetical protein